jgi:hypothetical protein
MLEYIKRKQKELEAKKQREAELEAQKEAIRIAKIEEQIRKKEEAAARKKLLLEQQEAERVRQKHIQAKEKLTEDRWNEQLNTLLGQLDQEKQEKKKLEEIRIIIQNRQPPIQEIDWNRWLADPLNQRLAELDFERAEEMFKYDNLMAKRRHGTRADGGRTVSYALSFTGDTNVATRRGDLVATDFNPDNPDGLGKPLAESGFTVSYWVRPDELGGDMFCIGRKAHNNARFTFGISSRKKGYFGVGSNQHERSWETMLDTAGVDKATHLELDSGDWILKTDGTWYHFAVTYAGTDAGANNMLRKIYMNGQQIWGTGVSDPTHPGNINWSDTGREMSKGLSFGMRAVRGSGTNTSYNNGWACALSEVAIFNTEKNADFIEDLYNTNGPQRPGARRTRKDLRNESGIVGYWKFNKGSGTTVTDHSGNGNHGTLTNDSFGDDGGAAFASGVPTWDSSPFSNS